MGDQRLLPSRRTARARLLTAAGTVALLLLGLVGVAQPADASPQMPHVLLTGGAAEVGRTYTASVQSDGQWPDGTQELRYQWYRGDHDGDVDTMVPISGADQQSYTLTDDDHWSTIQVVVQATDGGSTVLGQRASAVTNWIMYNMAPPVLSGTPHVGQVITATLGDWASEWDTTLTWRNTGVPIPGENGLTYRARPRDAGKEISLLALGEYTFPNGVHPIDRYASRMRISWATKSFLKGKSTKRGTLKLTMIAYAAGANQKTVRGKVHLYDGSRLLKSYWIPSGRKSVTLKHLSSGVHHFRLAFDANPWFDKSSTSRSFRVH